ncbi:MAG: hypothetical protein UU73_C0003G0180 [Candidatus Daviesbacteria bacterium GW2011_GWA1_41_61]|uniref:Uncharacterized protein n=1 Tax=Candidatus Daviesbacteria bacterium GW2011_GWA2_40_9 TaxID=1618424 RepID=A0A0G0U997_9BACT|nr:MAG: hypothetical protein UU26_C0003G0046 [Candidatus Daviesbacteria bacterium GW2011_GWC1_40_9]KKR83861.1 MAG: hypothetical protein UU29_C0001G0081 [Candidatus Daviesbacteria bacterium GW2011_GWA2_40_9]KKR93470.1 MAG: hypothetical protein UU44_C0002G0131 [Candidatus Daviesbacteria bacterium GW2011_GWB1_41_15]KKS14981.1 MAG: hypothetical protein UU73_C0003G0180 [Candidatus Daviesbacteria bacterium GW2011_GWA1_41_61]
MTETELFTESIPYGNIESLQELEIAIVKRAKSGQTTRGEGVVWQGSKIVRIQDREFLQVGENGCTRIDVRVGARGSYSATIDPVGFKGIELPPAWQEEENP